jgi:hypothetical protein
MVSQLTGPLCHPLWSPIEQMYGMAHWARAFHAEPMGYSIKLKGAASVAGHDL